MAGLNVRHQHLFINVARSNNCLQRVSFFFHLFECIVHLTDLLVKAVDVVLLLFNVRLLFVHLSLVKTYLLCHMLRLCINVQVLVLDSLVERFNLAILNFARSLFSNDLSFELINLTLQTFVESNLRLLDCQLRIKMLNLNALVVHNLDSLCLGVDRFLGD